MDRRRQRHTGRRVGLARRGAALLVLVAACARGEKEEAPDWDMPPPISEAEQATAVTACDAYIERVCRCAESQPELAEVCTFAKPQAEALEQLLEMVNGKRGKLSNKELRITQATARKTYKACFDLDAKLDPATCPRHAPTEPDPVPPNGDSAANALH